MRSIILTIGAAAFCVLGAAVAERLKAAEPPENPFRAGGYAALRMQLRGVLPFDAEALRAIPLHRVAYWAGTAG